ncbi:MAG: DNA internalization-related competence protein ComEC/Rec2 [Myxococcota bacterium]
MKVAFWLGAHLAYAGTASPVTFGGVVSEVDGRGGGYLRLGVWNGHSVVRTVRVDHGLCGQPGSWIYGTGVPRGPRARGSLGAWDEADRWRLRGIDGGLNILRCRSRGPTSWRQGVVAFIHRGRAGLTRAIRRRDLGQPGEVLVSLSTGDRSGLAPQTRQDLARSGLAHLLAISGLHVGLWGALVFGVGWWVLRFWPAVVIRWGAVPAAALFSMPPVGLYIVWMGGSASAVRAGAMVSLVLLSRVLRRRPEPWRIFFLAMAGILLMHPSWIQSPSLQLSAAAVAAILAARQRSRGPWWARSLRAGWAATLGTAPVTLAWFGTVNVTGGCATLVAGPLVSWVLVPGAAAAAVVEAVGPLAWADTIWLALAKVAQLLLVMAESWAGLPFSTLRATPGRWPGLVPSVLVLLLRPTLPWSLNLAGKARNTAGRRMGRGLRAGLAYLAMAGVLFWPGPSVRPPRVTFLPVGHGDAAVVEVERRVVVVDSGTLGATRSIVEPYLAERGHRRIDLLVLSHRDADHDGGAEWLRRAFDVVEVWSVSEPPSSGESRRFGPLRIENVGPTVGEGSDNDRSLVVMVGGPECRILFTGDISAEREAAIAPFIRSVDVVKVPHHGSRTSSSLELLRRARPRVAVISTDGHRYGLPSPEVERRYRESGAKVLRTDQEGSVSVLCDPTGLRVSTFRRGSVFHEG